MKDPWVKWFAGDFLHGVSELGANEGWVYVIVLNLIYDGEEPWELDLERLARRCRLRPTSVQKALDTLISMKKLSLVDGRLTNAKAEKSIKSRQKVRQNSVDAATARWENSDGKDSNNNDRDDAPALHPQSARNAIPEARSQSQNDSTPREGGDWPEGRSLDHARRLCEEVDNSGKLDTARSPGLIQSLGLLDRWRKAGASWEHDVVPVVTALALKAKGTVTTWSYFDGAIAESIAANRAALAIPEHDDVQRPRHDRPVNGHDTRKAGAMAFLAELRANDQRDDPGGGDHEG